MPDIPSHVYVIHLYGNLLLALFYSLIFISVAKKLILQTALRNHFSYAIVALFFLISLGFLFQALFTEPWQLVRLELIWLAVGALPPLFFIVSRKKHSFILGTEDNFVSNTKFNKLKDEFLSVASHELRTPLSVINGFAEILVREKLGPLNDEQKRRVRKILMQGQRLNRIIDDLLDLSRIRSGKMDVRKDVFDLVPVLKACLDDHQIVTEQQNIELVDDIPDVLPDVIGDLERVTQIIVNLLNNAIKYTEPGGHIRLTADYDKNRHEVRVEVSDTGIGIASEDQQRLFQEFFRASHHHARKYSGSGLGLAIVKQLVEVQGGSVGVKSEGVGKGSSFYFTLPSAKTKKEHNGVFRTLLSEETLQGGSSSAASPSSRG